MPIVYDGNGAPLASPEIRRQPGVVGPDGTEPLRLELTYPDGPRLTVQVLDREGRPGPFPSLEVTEIGQGRLPTIHGNAQGKATYGPLAPGRYTVTARISRRDAEILGYGDEVVESVVVEDGGDILLQLVVD